jgi:diaminohydroxyphosphoribosylaminopyrimidine deaminase / 5-amino-6-(5-phosphoribosylamino)uracil reductase
MSYVKTTTRRATHDAEAGVPSLTDTDRHNLTLAARQALRAAGDVEPNPLVGAVIVRDDHVIGIGHHRRFGGPHAEIEALESARRQGNQDAIRGSTMYITLEPCAHHGKTPPCTRAIIDAGIAAVVIAARDPNPVASHGAAVLHSAGIEVRFSDASPLAAAISRPFIKRITTGLPWVIAKWAQTIDGRIATRTGESKWISGEQSRRRVHRLRARVDAIITGLGTVLTDDPLLTAREARRVRRLARRVVVDPQLQTPADSALVRSNSECPLTIASSHEALKSESAAPRRDAFARAGIELLGLGPGPGGLDLAELLHHLAAAHGATTVMVESGPVLLGSLLGSDLVDQAIVYIAPTLLGDEHAAPVAVGRIAHALSDARQMVLQHIKRRGPDVELNYTRPQ